MGHTQVLLSTEAKYFYSSTFLGIAISVSMVKELPIAT